MSGKNSISATNLAVHQHLNCDLYIHNVYNRPLIQASSEPDPSTPSELAKAQYQRGLDWETCLYNWLDQSHLLMKVPHLPLDADTLMENIMFDDRDHFFITGLSFWPPQDQLNKRFNDFGRRPLYFGLAKPDLLEITRHGAGVLWRVVDAKASKNVKTSHHIQTYFYDLCLNHLFSNPFYHATGSAAIWLPPEDGFLESPPSLEDIKHISIPLLAQALDVFIFRDLPRIINLPRDQVKWHYNPVCHGCKYEPDCRMRTLEEGKLGTMPNISIDESRVLADLLHLVRMSSISSVEREDSTDIEDLHQLIAKPSQLESLYRYSAITVKRAKRILALPKKFNPNKPVLYSPLVESALTNTIQVISKHNHTCPGSEDIAVFISIVDDPASPSSRGEFFCISTFTHKARSIPPLIQGPGKDFIPALARFIRSLETLQPSFILSTQFYVWSPNEHHLLQSHIINAALTASTSDDDVRPCIGALAQGASLLQTTFQPMLLSGALLSFLGNGKKTKAEYVACLERMGLSTFGTVEVLRKRVEAAVSQIQEQATNAKDKDRHKEFGQLPRIVVLKKEIERQLALPVPGYWDLLSSSAVLLGKRVPCPTDEEVFRAYKQGGSTTELEGLLDKRNRCMAMVLRNLRQRAVTSTGHSLFVNEARVLSTSFMDICRQPHIRKLFFMQQFEVLAKLTELWQARLEGCPDAALLEYASTVQGPKGPEHIFRLISGNVDTPSSDRDHGFFDYILTLDCGNSNNQQSDYDGIPVEALFDDLRVSGLVFPLNRFTKPKWGLQDPLVQRNLCVADVRNVFMDAEGRETNVAVRTWGTWDVMFEQGCTYRLSPRLVDFNTNKLLSTLFEADLRWGSEIGDLYGEIETDDHRRVPFLQLILDPKSFGPVPNAKQLIKSENDIQKLFRDLKGLGNDVAGSLVLKASQHRATQQILSNRLSVIWGPPGTGKTYTIALSLLRLLDLQRRQGDLTPKIVFITAITHAAIEACCHKLRRLIAAYRSIEALPTTWLDSLSIELVKNGNDQAAPPIEMGSGLQIYAGTVYQLWNYTKRHRFEVDCVVIDEAGQISLGAVSLVLRSLGPAGRIIIAGDSEQLAPILSARYPQLKTNALFGSVLDCLMFLRLANRPPNRERMPSSSPQDTEQSSQSTIVQLTENFRLNPDLGEFVSTIYSRQFKPQKVQARRIATALHSLVENPPIADGILPLTLDSAQIFLVALSNVMFRKPQSILSAPEIDLSNLPTSLSKTPDALLLHHPVSLSLLRLKTRSSRTDDIAYETHVRGEAALAAALVVLLRRCMPEEDIFVATPHRIQREAVKSALSKIKFADDTLSDMFDALEINGRSTKPKVTVDTIERLQGSEAAFVICLFSLPRSFISDLPFLLERRRLNVAISRARTLCMLISSEEVLCPSVKVLANEDTAKGYAFLKAYEQRAWSYNLTINVDHVLRSSQ